MFDGADADAADVVAQILLEVAFEVGAHVRGGQVKAFAEGFAGQPFGRGDLLLDVLQQVEGAVGGFGNGDPLVVGQLQIVVGRQHQDAVEPRPDQLVRDFAAGLLLLLDEGEEPVDGLGVASRERDGAPPDGGLQRLFDAPAEVVGRVAGREAEEDIGARAVDREAVDRVGRDQEERPRPVAAQLGPAPLFAHVERAASLAHVERAASLAHVERAASLAHVGHLVE